MERAFVAYSQGRAVVPPVGELLFEDPPADVHIKYGYVRGDGYYVIKVASGFYQNPQLGLPSSNGLMLLFSRHTGVLEAVLLDEGHLTDVRTAAAGAVAARYLAPREPGCIGIIGSGIQAALQLANLARVTSCRKVLVWGRNPDRVAAWREQFANGEFDVAAAADIDTLVDRCRLIVTTTPATAPLLEAVHAGTHITAVGADAPHKQELAPSVLAAADIVAVDSLSQSDSRGEVYRAVDAGELGRGAAVELGRIVSGELPGRTRREQITVADLTGVATQDIEIARAVYEETVHAH